MAFQGEPALLKKISADLLKARDLSEEESKKDPESNPYKSKYEARRIVKDVLAEAEEQLNVVDLDEIEMGDEGGDESGGNEESFMNRPINAKVLLAALEYELGVNCVETEEVTTGEEHLQSSLNYLDSSSSSQFSSSQVSLFIAIKCQIGIIWSNRSDHTKSLSLFQEAEHAFEEYKASVGVAPMFYKDILLAQDKRMAKTLKERETEFESQHTLTLYYIAQSFNNLGEREKSGKYCHITLVRQMETGQYEAMDWALNCATLGQYYITKDMYNFARYCLACASKIGEEAMDKFNPEDYDESEIQRAEDKVKKMDADIARCWAKYCLNLLISSHQKMLQDAAEGGTSNTENQENSSEDDLKYLRFKGLEVTSLEEEVSDKVAVNYDEAKSVFLCGQRWLQKAKDFYIFDGYVSDFVEINQDLSQFFKYLSFFDESFERRCKMHKRRIDLLNAPLLELNPKHFLQICRQLTFETGEIYSDMGDLKKAIMEQNATRVSAENIRKYNKLLLQGIQHYQGFIDSYKSMNKDPDKYEDDAVRGVLLAHFYMARLHSKYLTPERGVKAEHMLKEKNVYEVIVNYCDSHPDMPKVFEEELAICREMVALFPAKVNQVLDG